MPRGIWGITGPARDITLTVGMKSYGAATAQVRGVGHPEGILRELRPQLRLRAANTSGCPGAFGSWRSAPRTAERRCIGCGQRGKGKLLTRGVQHT